jgi:hypothetical protein
MGTTLTGLTPATTYDALIKVTDNGPLSATAKRLSDGLGNDSVVALSTTAVGIGTTSPTQLLHVAGNVRITGAFYDGNNAAGTSGQILSSTGTATDWVSKSDLGLVDGSGTANFVSKWSDTDTLTNSLIFDNGTNVAIGTTTAAGKLNIKGSAGSGLSLTHSNNTVVAELVEFSGAQGAGLTLKNAAGTTNVLLNAGGDSYINGGNVGIGTASNSYTAAGRGNLNIAGSGGAILGFQIGGSPKGYVFHDNTNLQLWNEVAGDLLFGANAAEKMRILSSGNVGIGTTSPASKLDVNGDIATSGDIILSGAKGIYFDNAASKYLDDYEQGTWTMGISFGGASVGQTNNANTGTYTKIGRQVTVNGFFRFTDKGSSTGDAKITGLPFAIGGGGSNYSAVSLRFSEITFTNQFQAYGEVTATTIGLEEITVLGTRTTLTDADFANNSAIMLSFTYFV